MKYVLFGAGRNGREALNIIEKQDIGYFVDNDINKRGTDIDGIPIYYYPEKQQEMKKYNIVITVSEPYSDQIANQLRQADIFKFDFLKNMQIEKIREKINSRLDYIKIYKSGIEWISENIVKSDFCFGGDESGMIGICIPSLLKWGYRSWAVRFAERLCNIQNVNGSWGDAANNEDFLICNTAQSLEGLLEIKDIYVKANGSIKAGCEWLADKLQGMAMTVASEETSETRDKKKFTGHYVYGSLPLLINVSEIYGEEKYNGIVCKIRSCLASELYESTEYFEEMYDNCICLIETLIDIGEAETAQKLLKQMMGQKGDGIVSAVSECENLYKWFRMALLCYRVGYIDQGNKIFEYVCRLLDEIGQWKETRISEYNAEIFKSIKYFLDALYYKIYVIYNNLPYTFQKRIDINDGRYVLISKFARADKPLKVLDVGCGTGRYLRNLLEDVPQNTYYAVDFSQQVLDEIKEEKVIKFWGRHCQLPFDDNIFDYTYTCEAFCHAIDAESAVREMVRVTKRSGMIAIVDKNKSNYGRLEIAEWEQWYDEKELKEILEKFCDNVKVYSSVPYERKNDSLFSAWFGTVR